MGTLEQAQGGTILLDEVGKLPLLLQAKLVRVLNETRYFRIGGSEPLPLTARILATSTRDLKIQASEGDFRHDLLERLMASHLQLPPLRDRLDDLPDLIRFTLHNLDKSEGGRLRFVDPRVLEAFRKHDWPGNVRELQHVLRLCASMADPSQELLSEIPPALVAGASAGDTDRRSEPAVGATHDGATFESAEREVLIGALARSRGSVSGAARSLGVSRGRLYQKIRKHDIELDRWRRAQPG